MQSPSGVADQLVKASLNVDMDVFKLGFPIEFAGFDLFTDASQTGDDGCGIGLRDDALFGEHLGMRDRTSDVLSVQATIDVERNCKVASELGAAYR